MAITVNMLVYHQPLVSGELMLSNEILDVLLCAQDPCRIKAKTGGDSSLGRWAGGQGSRCSLLRVSSARLGITSPDGRLSNRRLSDRRLSDGRPSNGRLSRCPTKTPMSLTCGGGGERGSLSSN